LHKELLDQYTPPPLDPGVDEALCEFIDKRKASFADSSY